MEQQVNAKLIHQYRKGMKWGCINLHSGDAGKLSFQNHKSDCVINFKESLGTVVNNGKNGKKIFMWILFREESD